VENRHSGIQQFACSFPKGTMNALQEETKLRSEIKLGLKSSQSSFRWPEFGRQPHCWAPAVSSTTPPTHPTCPALCLPGAQQPQFQHHAKSSN